MTSVMVDCVEIVVELDFFVMGEGVCLLLF
jgi:hypothetical protein